MADEETQPPQVEESEEKTAESAAAAEQNTEQNTEEGAPAETEPTEEGTAEGVPVEGEQQAEGNEAKAESNAEEPVVADTGAGTVTEETPAEVAEPGEGDAEPAPETEGAPAENTGTETQETPAKEQEAPAEATETPAEAQQASAETQETTNETKETTTEEQEAPAEAQEAPTEAQEATVDGDQAETTPAAPEEIPVEGAEPAAESAEAATESAEPATESTEPAAESAEQSATEGAEPAVESAEPATENAEPAAESAEQPAEAQESAAATPAAEETPAEPTEQEPAKEPSPVPKSATPQAVPKSATPQAAPKSATPQAAPKSATPQAQAEKTATPQEQPEKAGTPQEPSVPTPPPPPEMNVLDVEAERRNAQMEEEDEISMAALNLVWSFGMNKHIPVLNITNETRKMIAYACAHAGVLYDFKNNKQRILQGHTNPLTCMCVSEDKRWLATADKGQNNLVIIWDTNSATPVQTLFDPHPEGVTAIAMTPDAKFIATLSAAQDQVLAIWDWTSDGDRPICTAQLSYEHGHQNYILFNPEDTSQLVTNSETQVIFYMWKNNKLDFVAPPLTDQDFNKQVGKYSQTIYQSNSTRCLTATSVGNLVVWDSNKPLTKVISNEPSADKKALKLVKLQDKAINVLTTSDKFIVTGDVLGHVRILDQTLKLIMWYQDFNLGPVNSLSFAYAPEFQHEESMIWGIKDEEHYRRQRLREQSDYPPDATIAAKKLILRDFVVGTTSATYGHIKTDGTVIDVIHRDHDSAVHALAAHPTLPLLAVGSYSGLLKIWNYEKRICQASRYFERGNMIRCCTFDPKGQYMAVGFTNGAVRVLDAINLMDETSEPFRYARDVVTHCAFSHNSEYLATADAEFTVSVFKATYDTNGDSWIYLGRHRAHYKLIKDLMFGIELDSDKPRLLSLGEDRTLVEYNLEDSSKDDLRVKELDRIEQSAIPQCMAWYPPLTKEHFIVTANDQFKFKLYNATTKMCRKTLLGPTYGSPLQKVAILPTADPISDKRYVAYITDDKIGLHSLPLTGNPHQAMALICHPAGVANLQCSYDGRYVFTAGGPDCTVHMWHVNINALEAQTKLGGEDLIPFYGLLDGGREGELFAELENYFYYAQIRSQGVNTMDSREVSVKIPLSEVPFVMRAMGFYPSEQEIEDMLNEVKFSQYVDTGKYVDDIELGDFIKLYINHRPAFGLSPDKLQWAFDVLGIPTSDGPAIDRGELLDILQSKGEHMTEYELAEYLTNLLGYNEEGGSSELHEFDPSTAGDIIEENLPQDITVGMFADELLGLSMYTEVPQMIEGEQV